MGVGRSRLGRRAATFCHSRTHQHLHPNVNPCTHSDRDLYADTDRCTASPNGFGSLF